MIELLKQSHFLFIFLLSVIEFKNEGYEAKSHFDILTSQLKSLSMVPWYKGWLILCSRTLCISFLCACLSLFKFGGLIHFSKIWLCKGWELLCQNSTYLLENTAG